MVGQWHLGHATVDMFPHRRGFEHFHGNVTGGIGYWNHNHGGGHDWQRNAEGETLREEGYSTTLLTDEAIRVIEGRDRDRPTFLYLAYNAPRLPNEAPAQAIAACADIQDPDRRIHAAMVSEMDRGIGRVLDALERERMLDDTLIWFMSDNGGVHESAFPPLVVGFVRQLVALFGEPLPIETLEFARANIFAGASDNTPLAGGRRASGGGGGSARSNGGLANRCADPWIHARGRPRPRPIRRPGGPPSLGGRGRGGE